MQLTQGASQYFLWRINNRHSAPARGPGHNGETMNNELLSGTQLRFIEQSSQYEASFTELYCATPTSRKHGKARTQKRHTNRDNMSINAMQAAPFIEPHNDHPRREKNTHFIYLQHFYSQPFTFSA